MASGKVHPARESRRCRRLELEPRAMSWTHMVWLSTADTLAKSPPRLAMSWATRTAGSAENTSRRMPVVRLNCADTLTKASSDMRPLEWRSWKTARVSGAESNRA